MRTVQISKMFSDLRGTCLCINDGKNRQIDEKDELPQAMYLYSRDIQGEIPEAQQRTQKLTWIR